MSDATSPVGLTTARSEDPGSAASSLQSLPFRHEAESSSFPGAGVLLLMLLLMVAVWAWWAGRGRGLARWQSGRRRPIALLGRAAAVSDGVQIVDSVRFDVGGRVHVVQWRDEQILFATHGASPIVVLGRRSASPRDPEAA